MWQSPPGIVLDRFIQDINQKAVAFNWRDWNCLHFGAAWIKWVLEVDVSGQIPKLNSKWAVRDFLATDKSKELSDYIEGVVAPLGLLRVAPSFSGVGDLVLSQWPERDILVLGICNGPTNCYLTVHGQVEFKSTAITHCWKLV